MNLVLPVLETERLVLRKITLEDVEAIFSYGSNEEVSKYATWDTHRTISDTRGFVEFVLNRYEDKKLAPWGIEYKENGKLIGTIDFVSWQPNHNSAEIGYVLSQDYWGKGIVTEAAIEVLRFGFEHLDLIRIQARCFEENIGSSRVMEKIGMTFEGKLRKSMFIKGEHQDLLMYSILIEEFSARQAENIPTNPAVTRTENPVLSEILKRLERVETWMEGQQVSNEDDSDQRLDAYEDFELWNQVLEKLKKTVSIPSFETWLVGTIAKRLDDDTIIVFSKNEFQADWLRGRYKESIFFAIIEVAGKTYDIEFDVVN